MNPKARCVLADPPWAYAQWSDRKHGAAAAAIDVMATSDIAAIPVGEWCDEDCALFLWGTWPKVPDAIQVMRAWGFDFVTGLPWVKVYKGGDAYRGIGFWTQGASEYLLIGKRGDPDRVKGTPVIGLLVGEQPVLYGSVSEHSRKPEAIHEWIERLFPGGPFLELFARRPRAGWACWGGDLGFVLSAEGVREVPVPARAKQGDIFG